MTTWRAVPEDDTYEISSDGQVRRAKLGPKSRGVSGRVLRQYKRPDGYKSVNLGRKRNRLVHRLVAFAFCEQPEGCDPHSRKWVVNHLNRDKKDNRAENLEWVSQADNLTYCPNCGYYGREMAANYEYEDSCREG